MSYPSCYVWWCDNILLIGRVRKSSKNEVQHCNINESSCLDKHPSQLYMHASIKSSTALGLTELLDAKPCVTVHACMCICVLYIHIIEIYRSNKSHPNTTQTI